MSGTPIRSSGYWHTRRTATSTVFRDIRILFAGRQIKKQNLTESILPWPMVTSSLLLLVPSYAASVVQFCSAVDTWRALLGVLLHSVVDDEAEELVSPSLPPRTALLAPSSRTSFPVISIGREVG